MIHLLVILPAVCVLLLTLIAYFDGKKQGKVLGYHPLSTWFSMVVLFIMLGVLSLFWWQAGFSGASKQLQLLSTAPDWLDESRYPWIPSLGISWYLAIDGLSVVCLALVVWLALVCLVLYRRHELSQVAHITEHHKAMRLVPACIMSLVVSATVIILAIDMFLVVFAWCLLVITYYLLWLYVRYSSSAYEAAFTKISATHEPDTQLSDSSKNLFLVLSLMAGFCMLSALLLLVVTNYQHTGQFTFSYIHLLSTKLPSGWSAVAMFSFIGGVFLLLPVALLHIWLLQLAQIKVQNKRHVPAFLMQLALVLSVVSLYMIWRFVLPLFPETNADWTSHLSLLGLVTAGYAALLAYATADVFSGHYLKRPRQLDDTEQSNSAVTKDNTVLNFSHATWHFYGYIAMFHAGVALFAIYTGDILSWQSVLLYVVSTMMGVCGLYVLHNMMQQITQQTHAPKASSLRQVSLLFFASVAAGFPLFGIAIAQFQLLLGIITTHPKQAMCLMLVWLLFMVAMGRYVINVLRLSGSVSGTVDNETQGVEPQKQRYTLEWALLAVMALVIINLGVAPQKLMDTSYESFRWIHHVYVQPRKLHGQLHKGAISQPLMNMPTVKSQVESSKVTNQEVTP